MAKQPADPEKARRQRHHELVDQAAAGLDAALQAGRALRVIRDEETFSVAFDTFEAFVTQGLDLNPANARRLIAAAEGADGSTSILRRLTAN